MKTTALANLIKRDLLSDRPPAAAAPECVACGRPFSYRWRQGAFCSDRCAQAYDNGFPVCDPKYVDKVTDAPSSSWRVVAGPPRIEVDSQLYAPILERDERRRREAEAKRGGGELIRPRRYCRCGAKIPVWIKGARVPISRTHCFTCSPEQKKRAA
jgi:hypothetical protein